jgi:hypothetical protein
MQNKNKLTTYIHYCQFIIPHLSREDIKYIFRSIYWLKLYCLKIDNIVKKIYIKNFQISINKISILKVKLRTTYFLIKKYFLNFKTIKKYNIKTKLSFYFYL